MSKCKAGRNGEVLVPVPKDLAELVGLKPGDAVILRDAKLYKRPALIVDLGDTNEIEPIRVS